MNDAGGHPPRTGAEEVLLQISFEQAIVASGNQRPSVEPGTSGSDDVVDDAPLYCCHGSPYHLCHFEVQNTVARAVLPADATIAPEAAGGDGGGPSRPEGWGRDR